MAINLSRMSPEAQAAWSSRLNTAPPAVRKKLEKHHRVNVKQRETRPGYTAPRKPTVVMHKKRAVGRRKKP